MVSAVAQVQSLAWEVPHTTGGAKKQKKKDKLTSWRGWGSRLSMGRGTDADSGDHGLSVPRIRRTVCHQALVSPVASDLMSSPLRKRIRSPDLREALSAGLPGSKEGGCGRQSSPAPMSFSCFSGKIRGGWQRRARVKPAVPTLEPAPLCSQML